MTPSGASRRPMINWRSSRPPKRQRMPPPRRQWKTSSARKRPAKPPSRPRLPHPHRRRLDGGPMLLCTPASGRASPPVADVDVDVEVHLRNAALLPPVRTTGMPRPVASSDVAHLGDQEAAPFSAARQRLAAHTAELESEQLFLAVRVAKNVRAQVAVVAVVVAGDLLFGKNGFPDEPVGRARHHSAAAMGFNS